MTGAKPFVIDADSHVEEDENVWQHLDAAFAPRRPTIIERPVGPGERYFQVYSSRDSVLPHEEETGEATVYHISVTSAARRGR